MERIPGCPVGGAAAGVEVDEKVYSSGDESREMREGIRDNSERASFK